eukprot:Hpha_TRINITY_DN14997_c0_g1::TRINITY_DN14997_c0_g1_i1::g.143182::m.143182
MITLFLFLENLTLSGSCVFIRSTLRARHYGGGNFRSVIQGAVYLIVSHYILDMLVKTKAATYAASVSGGGRVKRSSGTDFTLAKWWGRGEGGGGGENPK